MKGTCCYYCKWWNPLRGTNGECRRYPKPASEKFLITWPMLSATDWCGEFKAKGKEKGEENVQA